MDERMTIEERFGEIRKQLDQASSMVDVLLRDLTGPIHDPQTCNTCREIKRLKEGAER